MMDPKAEAHLPQEPAFQIVSHLHERIAFCVFD